MPSFPKGKCLLCGSPVPKDKSFCPQTDHYMQWTRSQGKLTVMHKAEEKKLAVASRKVTEETYLNIEEKRTATRAEMYFLETEGLLRQARVAVEAETIDERIREKVVHWGTLICPAGLVAAVGVDIAVFLIGNNTNLWSIVAILLMTIFFEAILMVMTFALHRLRKRMYIASSPEALPAMEKQRNWAGWTWAALAFVSATAQFAALTGADFTHVNIVLWTIIGIRALGTTAADFAIAIAMPIDVNRPVDVAAALKQEAKDLRELADATKERLESERYVREMFIGMQQPVHIAEIREVR